MLRDDVAKLGDLLDEALDYIAEVGGQISNQPSPVIQATGETIQQTLSTLVMNKLMQAYSHGDEKQEVRPIQEIDEETQPNQEI